MMAKSNRATQAPHDPLSQPDALGAGPQTRLRLWPGVALMAVFWLVRVWACTGDFAMSKFFVGMLIAPLVVLAGLVVWWLFASRLRLSDRLLVAGTLALVTAVTRVSADASLRGTSLVIFVLPVVASAWLGWLVLSFPLAWPVRRAGVLLIFIAAGACCPLLRIDGMNGSFAAKFSWRWTPTPEQKLLAELKSKQARPPDVQPPGLPGDAGLSEEPGDWPGFRGPRRDGRLSGVRIKTDWQQPPRELWRHRIGPGWSSFAVAGNRLFTQEQRGDDEYVVCYEATTGVEAWAHHDATRFSELAAGPGPRATPAFHAGRLYALGANGLLNCLDAASGKRLWSRDIVADSGAAMPQWGFASSPLVAQGAVAVFAGAPNGKTLVAYEEKTGRPAWTASVGPASARGSLSYCSPQLTMVDDVEQILLATNVGLSAFQPADGKELWHYSWPAEGIARIVQPALVGDGDVLLQGAGAGSGVRRIHVRRNGEGWLTDDQWTSRKFKPYFNDGVVLNDYLYGFNGNKFVCVSLADGSETWQARGYGNGQVLLLVDQELLLILSEEGDVALLPARPEKCEELYRFKAVEGKTWNHPVIAHGKLFIRNGEEAACFLIVDAISR